MLDDSSNGQFLLRRRFPVLRIFESAGLALSPASLVIATIVSVLLGFVSTSLDGVLIPEATIKRGSAIGERWPRVLSSISGLEVAPNASLSTPWSTVARPLVFSVTTSQGIDARFSGVVRFALAFSAGTLVGLILCRRSALFFLGDDESTLPQSIDFGIRHWGAALAAPLIPVAAAMLIGLFVSLFSLPGFLSYIGPAWLYATTPVTALMGFGLAVLLLAALFGWPIMVAAIAVDNCDSFGGLSRAYSVLTGRPWQVIGYLLASTFIGLILMFVVRVFGDMTIWCAMSAAVIGCGETAARRSLMMPLTWIVREVEGGAALSFFWSAATVIYLFLRQDVDGIPLDHVASEVSPQSVRDPLPVVGIPATDSQTLKNGQGSDEVRNDQ